MPMIAVNGTQLFYELSGTSEIPVVLAHGSWGNHHNWDAVAPALARSFRLLRYDRRGHSQSPRSTSQGSLLEDAMDLAALLEALDMAPAHVVGNSGGAAVALRLATVRPQAFRSLTVHEPPLFGLLAADPAMKVALAAVGQRIGAVAELLRAGDSAAGARQFVETIAVGPGGWDQLPDQLRQTFIFNAPTFLDETRDPDGTTLDLRALERFREPTLLSRGDQSAPFFPAVVSKLAQAMPHAVQHVFVGAGHVPHLSHPDVYVDVISRFVSSAEAARGRGMEARDAPTTAPA
jgi:pimeloyl-ACP methyl ester carboxylesterase